MNVLLQLLLPLLGEFLIAWLKQILTDAAKRTGAHPDTTDPHQLSDMLSSAISHEHRPLRRLLLRRIRDNVQSGLVSFSPTIREELVSLAGIV